MSPSQSKRPLPRRPRGLPVPRRKALRALASAAAAGWLGGGKGLQILAEELRRKPPSETLALAIVGCGGQGAENLKRVRSENIVALCDVDGRSAAPAFREFPAARRYRDFRKMLDEAGRNLDAVVVSTPDHMHAPVSLAAMRLGKHVYCEKPLTWSIEEARLMARVAGEKKVATQMGTQGMALDRTRAGIEALRSGVLGEVTEIHVWTDRAEGWWPQGVGRPEDAPPAPEELDWDLWLGVAPPRPYHPAYCPFRWRGWKDFGTGAAGDMGVHNAAMVWAGLELGPPRSAEIVETSGLKPETFPRWSKLRIEFPPAGGRGPLTLWWYDGGQLPAADLVFGESLAKNGAIVVGKKGTLYSVEWTGADWRLLPAERFQGYAPPAPSLPRAPSESQHEEWIRASKGGPPAFSNFADFGSPLTELLLVANLALRTGEKIEWDPERMRAKGSPAGEPSIRREYRKGWEL